MYVGYPSQLITAHQHNVTILCVMKEEKVKMNNCMSLQQPELHTETVAHLEFMI